MKMDTDRIEKWKCLICGSRRKKISAALKDGTEVGFSMVCCECGHVDNFVTDNTAIPAFTIGLSSGRISDIEIRCGSSAYDKDSCSNTGCSCRKENSSDTKTAENSGMIYAKPKAIQNTAPQQPRNILSKLNPPMTLTQ